MFVNVGRNGIIEIIDSSKSWYNTETRMKDSLYNGTKRTKNDPIFGSDQTNIVRIPVQNLQ